MTDDVSSLDDAQAFIEGHDKPEMRQLTVADLIERLRELPTELPVYFRDTEGDWLPCRPIDVQTRHFHEMGEVIGRPGGWYITTDNEADPLNPGPRNGVGIG